MSREINTKIGKEELGYPFLRADQIKDGEVAEILSPAILYTTRFGNRRAIDVKLLRTGGIFRLNLNKTSLVNLVNAYGDESKKWVGKKIELVVTVIAGKKTIVVFPRIKRRSRRK